MNLLPYEHLIVKTRLNAKDIQKIIGDNIEKDDYLRFYNFEKYKPFVGDVQVLSFHITPILTQRNGLRPDIHGKVQMQEDGCTVEITMQPRRVVIFIFSIVLGLILLSSVLLLLFAIHLDMIETVSALVCAGWAVVMSLLFYCIPFIKFMVEMQQARKQLLALIQADIVYRSGLREFIQKRREQRN